MKINETFRPVHMNRESEAAVLGKILTDPLALEDALSLCTSDDFTSELYSSVFAAAAALRTEGMTVTPHTVRARIYAGIAETDPMDELATLALGSSRFQDVRDSARIVASMATRRRLDAHLEAGRERLLAYDRPVADCLSDVIEATGDALIQASRDRGYRTVAEAADDMMRNLESAMAGNPVPSIATGIRELDSLLGGLRGGQSVILAGRPGHGKSLLLSAVCKAAAEARRPAILFELEMSREELTQRLACDLDFDLSRCRDGINAPVAYTRLRNGRLSDAEFQRIFTASEALKALPLHIYDTQGLGIHEICAIAEKFAGRSGGLGLIGIDYLQLVRAGDRYRGQRVQEVSEVSVALKTLAKKTGWVCVAGCQLNREIEKREQKRPQLSDLRESGSIEQDADVVIGMYRPGENVMRERPPDGKMDPEFCQWEARYNQVREDLELSVLKNRSGPTGIIRAFVDVHSGAIRNGVEDSKGGRS